MKKIKQNKLDSIFSSKANVLKFLEKKLKKSKIEKIFDFTVADWNTNQNFILQKIQANFKNKKLIVRSSAIGEDSLESSQAGLYDSILDINSSSKESLTKAIRSIIFSYKTAKNNDSRNQILIQPQSVVKLSGVAFTRIPENGEPYYVINYHD